MDYNEKRIVLKHIATGLLEAIRINQHIDITCLIARIKELDNDDEIDEAPKQKTECDVVVDCLINKFPEIEKSLPGACNVLVGMSLKIKNHSDVVDNIIMLSKTRKLTKLEFNNGKNNFNDLVDELKNIVCLSSSIYNSSISIRKEMVG